MRKTREILRLKWQQCRSHRAVVKVLDIGLGTVSEIVGRARRAGITSWQEVEALTEGELEKEWLLDGPAEDIAPLEVLRAGVERQLPVPAPPQMVSTGRATHC